MNGQVHVVVYHLAEDAQSVSDAYHESSARLAGTPGLLASELQHGVADERSYAVVSRWAEWDDFVAWEAGVGHLDQTAPMRPFRDHTRQHPFEVFRVIARHPGESE